MQMVPSRTLRVRAARFDSMTMESSRGLWMKLSPTHTDSKAPDSSASAADANRSSTVVSPNSTPRLGRLKPHLVDKSRMVDHHHLNPFSARRIRSGVMGSVRTRTPTAL